MQFHKPVRWSDEKNENIKSRHQVGFDEVITGEFLAYYPKHPFDPVKYPRQQVFIIKYDNYPYFVPFVEEEDYIFLKNCIPERRFKFLIKGEI